MSRASPKMVLQYSAILACCLALTQQQTQHFRWAFKCFYFEEEKHKLTGLTNLRGFQKREWRGMVRSWKHSRLWPRSPPVGRKWMKEAGRSEYKSLLRLLKRICQVNEHECQTWLAPWRGSQWSWWSREWCKAPRLAVGPSSSPALCSDSRWAGPACTSPLRTDQWADPLNPDRQVESETV